jgi:hypothetical protein
MESASVRVFTPLSSRLGAGFCLYKGRSRALSVGNEPLDEWQYNGNENEPDHPKKFLIETRKALSERLESPIYCGESLIHMS